MKKRLLPFLLSIFIITSLFSISAFSADILTNFSALPIKYAELRTSESSSQKGESVFYIEVELPEAYCQNAKYISITPLITANKVSNDQMDSIELPAENNISACKIVDFPVPGKKNVYYFNVKAEIPANEDVKKLDYSITLVANYYRGDLNPYVNLSARSSPYLIAGTSTPWTYASSWMEEELTSASLAGLIPDSLKWSDLSKPITRAEFTGIAVRLYEVLSGKEAIPISKNPFVDTNNPYVLKAYNLGIVNGMSDTVFDPGSLVSREQVATILCRTMELTIPRSTSTVSSSSMKFKDDNDISSWARDSVYFMAKNGIINGIGNDLFAPKNINDEQEKTYYANATKESALVISYRCYDFLK